MAFHPPPRLDHERHFNIRILPVCKNRKIIASPFDIMDLITEESFASVVNNLKFKGPDRFESKGSDLTAFLLELLLRCSDDPEGPSVLLKLPYSHELSRWLPVLWVLRLIHQDYQEHPDTLHRHLLKDVKIKNRAIARIHSIQGRNLWLKGKEPQPFRITIEKELSIEVVTGDNNYATKAAITRLINNSPDCEIDNILGIFTHGRRDFFKRNIIVIGKIKDMESFARHSELNDHSLRNLFSIAKLQQNGTVSDLWKRYEGLPAMIFTNNISRLVEFLPDNTGENLDTLFMTDNMNLPPKYNTNMIFITDEQIIRGNEASFMDLTRKNIPMCIFGDYGSSVIEGLPFRGKIKEWKFTEPLWNGAGRDPAPFETFGVSHIRLRNMLSMKVERVDCETDDFDETHSHFHKITRSNIDIEGFKIKLFHLWSKFNKITRLINPKQDFSKDLLIIDKILNELKNYRLYLSEENEGYIKDVVESLKQFLQGNFNTELKMEKLNSILETTDNENIALILHPEEDLKWLNQYFTDNNVSYSIPHLLTFSEILRSSYIYDTVIVSGWFGKREMKKLIDNYTSKRIILLCYPFEKSPSLYLEGYIRQMTETFNDRDYWEKLLNLNLGVQKKEIVKKPASGESDIPDFDIADFTIGFSNNTQGEQRPDSIYAKMVHFGDCAGFYTDTHKFFVCSSVSDANEIDLVSLNNLSPGQQVLMLQAEKSMIKDTAEKMLIKSGYSDLIDKAESWKKALRNYDEQNSRNQLLAELKSAGVQRSDATIVKWIRDENLIGPRDLSNIDSIASMTGDSYLQNNLDDVKNAVKKVRKSRKKAARFLRSRLRNHLPEIKSLQNKDEDLTVEVAEIGKIFMRKIIDITSETEINYDAANKLQWM